MNESRNPNNTNTPEFTEQEKIIEKELSYRLNKIFWQAQDKLGRFARERQYSDELERTFNEAGIEFKREYGSVVANRNSNFADFIVEGRILIEVKTKPYLDKDDYYQTMRYLKTANLELGLIANFRQEYLKPKRIFNPDFRSGYSDKSSDSSGRSN